jgi:basic membrane protein A
MSHPRLHALALGASLLLLVALPAAACDFVSPQQVIAPMPNPKVVRICLATDHGGLQDNGLNHLMDVGLQRAVANLGVSAVPSSAPPSNTYSDLFQAVKDCAQQNPDLVITLGYLMEPAIGAVSGLYHNVRFAIIDGFGTDSNHNDLHHANVESLLFKEQEASALVGVIAGVLEKDQATPLGKNTIASVGLKDRPPVRRYLAGYKWGAHYEVPGLTVFSPATIQDFTDTTACMATAALEIEFGADILFQAAGPCGVGVLQTAGTRGVYSIGSDVDQGSVDPSVIASVLKAVDVVTYIAIKEVVQGEFVSGVQSYGLLDHAVWYQLDHLDQQLDQHSTHLAPAQVHTDVTDAVSNMITMIIKNQSIPSTDPAMA